ncbi:hypothetical protein CERSUDRAFT_69037 [Gelatoporia subvermispora B]|uniref:Uncharacterized protein n=1 Tax=Ceriporiopsis subvermispora (strain B) TaxID=914234 RepID=M2P970_CERS8|nr:hypothetical protein CERSUDRAFT_69037 [Gelatoporia subvermispora B]
MTQRTKKARTVVQNKTRANPKAKTVIAMKKPVMKTVEKVTHPPEYREKVQIGKLGKTCRALRRLVQPRSEIGLL